MPTTKLLRRSFLVGSAGLTLALPLLESMQAAFAGGEIIPTRYFLGFGGTSLGHDQGTYDMFTPERTGANYDITRALQPLADLGIAQHVSIVSHMELPWETNGVVPAGGRARGWHSSSPGPMLSGMRGRGSGGGEEPYGATSDQVAADAFGVNPLTYRVQVENYEPGGEDARGRISYRSEGGNIVRVDPVVSPRVAYESLFTGFDPNNDPEQSAQVLAAIRRRKSAIDMVLEDANGLMGRLGMADRARVEQHLDELRALEVRIGDIQGPVGGSCEMLPAPGNDPNVGSNYSGEEERAQILTDLVAMGFTCNISRVATIMYTISQSFLNAQPLVGHSSDIHEMGHYGVGGGDPGIQAVADGVAWHVKHFGRLVELLQNRLDLDGTPVLDHCALVLLFEGGWGYDAETNEAFTAHSSQNMGALIAGRAGGLNRNGGIHVNHNGGHPTQVINTALRAIGVDHEMGEVSGVVEELLA